MQPPFTPEQDKFLAELFALCWQGRSHGIHCAQTCDEDRIAYEVTIDRTSNTLTPEQEQFLSSLFVICRQGRSHGICCYSEGKSDRAAYAVKVLVISPDETQQEGDLCPTSP